MTRTTLPPFMLLAACATPAVPRPDVVIRDSAGIEIVETNRALWGDSMPWTVDTAPSHAIGQEEGDDVYLFRLVKGALRRDDGSVVIADYGSRQLRLFDSAGRFVRAAGRKGPGPGEFDQINRIARCGADGLWIDARSRISIWTIDLEYRREFAAPEGIMWPLICFGGKGIVVKEDIHAPGEDDISSTITYDSLQLFIRDSSGEHRRELKRISLFPRLTVQEGRGRIGIVHPLAAVTLLGANGPDVLIGTARSMEIQAYDATGRLDRIMRGPDKDLRLSDSIRDRYLHADLQPHLEQQRHWLGLAGNPMPATYPAYTALLTDRLGNIWIRRFSTPGSDQNRWGVFDDDGRFLGHVALPAGLEVFEIGADYVLGKVQDSLGVERVLEYRLNKR